VSVEDVATPAAVRRPWSRLAEQSRVPLLRDGYALALNSALTAVIGLLYWTVAARAYSPRVVGINSAIISSMMFVAGLATLNLSNILVRFLRETGEGARRLVLGSYVLTAAVAAVGALVFVVAGFLTPLGGEASVALVATFVAACVIWTVFVLQDGALTGLGRAVWVPVENGTFALVKLALLIAFAGMSSGYGIFASWTLGVALTTVGVNLLLFARVLRRGRGGDAAVRAVVRNRRFAGYVAADWVCASFWLASTLLLPVIVTASAGAAANASFAIAWALAYPLYMVAASIGSALVVHGAADLDTLPSDVRRAARQGLMLLTPAVIVLVAGAPIALQLFGDRYVEEGSGLLRLLALGALPNLALVLFVSEARARRHLRGAAIALGAQCAGSLLAVVPLLDALGVVGAGVAWLTSQCVVAIGVLFVVWRRDRPSPADARLARTIVGDARLSPRATDSDTCVFAVEPQEGPPLILKLGRSEAAKARISAHEQAVARLVAMPGLGDLADLLPAAVSSGDGWALERKLAGVDGRRVRGRTVLTATAAALTPLYAATAEDRAGDAVSVWLHHRLEAIAAVAGDPGKRILEALERDLRGRAVRTGWVHGDLWPGNVLLDPSDSTVTGIVDWEASRPEDLPLVDLAHLVLTARSQDSGRSFGTVAARLADGRDQLDAAERSVLDATCPPGEALRASTIARLGWMQHLDLRTRQVAVSRGGVWAMRTVRPLLRAIEA
jgi:O-antigen/teichoic acid export membrane protein